jgi:hypothetical protein
VDGAATSAVAPDPVDAQEGRVIGKSTVGHGEDAISECTNRLAGVQHPGVCDCLGEVETGGVALEHAIRHQD